MKKFFKIFFISLALLVVLGASYFFLIKKLDNDDYNSKDFISYHPTKAGPLLVPSRFVEGGRFYIKVPIKGGDTLMAVGDSGGGLSFILEKTIEKFKLQPKVKTALAKGVMPMQYILFGDIVKDKSIPQPIPIPKLILRRPIARVKEPHLIVMTEKLEPEIKMIEKIIDFDMFFGQDFFMRRAWTIDYINQQIWVNTPLQAGQPGVQKIGFKKNSRGENVYGHASTTMEVDGEVLDMLFDTGATMMLSENGKKLLNTTNNTIAGSFIAASVFDKWHSKHPDWKYYEKTDHDADAIEVPKVKLGAYEVGPVLFSKRPDEAWSQGMIQSMDKVVKGAIGGTAFQYLRIVIDYNSELIKFEQ